MIVRLAVCGWLAVSCLGGSVAAREIDKPALQRAKTYAAVTKQAELKLDAYWVSEKLDGVRGYWDGEVLRTRSGRKIEAPAWFTESFPRNVVLDGELWIGRGQFDKVSGVVRKEKPVEAEWRTVCYCIFDLPQHGGTFDARVTAMRALVERLDLPHLQMVEQVKVASQEELQQKLKKVVAAGGEGLMLHRGGAYYQASHGKRTNDLVKLKPLDDAEAVVVAHVPGKGKYQGMLGALVVEMANGTRFKVGSGLSDAERSSPPAVGTTITYQHNGMTSKGVPRFARFLRVRTTQ